MKAFVAAAIATLLLANGALAAPGYNFYPDGHESYMGQSGR